MFGKSKNNLEDLQRELAQYREGLAQIASHVGLNLGDRSTVQASVTAICDAIDHLRGSDGSPAEPGSEVRPLSPDVRQIKLDGAANLIIVQGDTPSLTVRCKDKAYLPKVLTSVSGRVLTIDNEPTVISQVGGVTTIIKGAVQQRFHGSIIGGVAGRDIHIGGGNVCLSSSGDPLAEVTVVLPEVSGLRVKGAGKATYRGFRQEELVLEISGSADVELEGAVDRLEAEISGSGDVSAYGLSARVAKLRVSGSGDIRATATDSVRARVSGSGKIKIAGNPSEKDTDVSGSGKIKFVD